MANNLKLRCRLEDCLTEAFTNGSGATLDAGALRQVEDNIGIVFEEVADGDEGVLILRAEDIVVPKKAGEAQARHERVYADVDNQQFTVTQGALGGQNGFVREAAAADDTEVEIYFDGLGS